MRRNYVTLGVAQMQGCTNTDELTNEDYAAHTAEN